MSELREHVQAALPAVRHYFTMGPTDAEQSYAKLTGALAGDDEQALASAVAEITEIAGWYWRDGNSEQLTALARLQTAAALVA